MVIYGNVVSSVLEVCSVCICHQTSRGPVTRGYCGEGWSWGGGGGLGVGGIRKMPNWIIPSIPVRVRI